MVLPGETGSGIEWTTAPWLRPAAALRAGSREASGATGRCSFRPERAVVILRQIRRCSASSGCRLLPGAEFASFLDGVTHLRGVWRATLVPFSSEICLLIGVESDKGCISAFDNRCRYRSVLRLLERRNGWACIFAGYH